MSTLHGVHKRCRTLFVLQVMFMLCYSHSQIDLCSTVCCESVIELTGSQAVADSLILQWSILCGVNLTPRALLSVTVLYPLLIAGQNRRKMWGFSKNGKPESSRHSIFQTTWKQWVRASSIITHKRFWRAYLCTLSGFLDWRRWPF